MDKLLNTAPCGFVSFIDDGSITWINATGLAILGNEAADVQGHHIHAILSLVSRFFFQTHVFPLIMLKGKADEIYLSLRSKAGEDVPVLLNAIRQKRNDQYVNDCVFMPIHQRNEYEDQVLKLKKVAEEANILKDEKNKLLEQSLKEKEMLLKEVYHRVKNNLQVVSSLINLQAATIVNKETIGLLKQSADRIKSMALLHEKLYQSKDLSRIDFNEYIHCLVEHLMFGYGIGPDRVKVSINIVNIFLDVDSAIPCGLIFNEVLSNALKHAFPNGREGEITVCFTQGLDEFSLLISDNGIGLPADWELKKSTCLGLELVSELTRQLMGQMALKKVNGTAFAIHFPVLT